MISQKHKKVYQKTGAIIKKHRRDIGRATKQVTQTIIRHKVFVSIFFVILAIVLFDYYTTGLLRSLFGDDPQLLIQTLRDIGSASWVIFLFTIILEVIIAPIPSIVIYAAGGIVYGPLWGSILLIIGNVIGSSICYLLARYFFQDAIEQRIPPVILTKFEKYAHKYGPFAIFFLRLNPFTSSDIFSYLAGITRIRFIPFIVSTTLGLTPLILLQSILGASIIVQSNLAIMLFVILSLVYVVLFAFLFLGQFTQNRKNLRK